MEMTTREEFLLGDENAPQLDYRDGCTALRIYFKKKKSTELYTLNRQSIQNMNYTLGC